MNYLQKLSRSEMRKVTGGELSNASCEAQCGPNDYVECTGGSGTCYAVDNVGCNSSGGGNAVLCNPIFIGL